MTELAGALMAAVVGAVARDVALAEGVAAEQLVHLLGDGVEGPGVAVTRWATPRTTRLLRIRPFDPHSHPSVGAYGWPHGYCRFSSSIRFAPTRRLSVARPWGSNLPPTSARSSRAAR